MKMLTFLVSILLAVVQLAAFNDHTWAAGEYPVKPISYVVPLEAGSDGDLLARQLVPKVSSALGQPVIIVNKPGGGSSIGYREVYAAKPDGYTIGLAMTTIVSNKIQGILPMDHEAFTIMGTYATVVPIVVASTKTQRPFKTFAEMVAFAKAHPGEVSIASASVGQAWWIGTMALQAETKLDFNIIPQPGTGAFSIAQVAGGHTDLSVLALQTAKAQIDSGNLRFLAVFGDKRFPPPYDGVPTLRDAGYDVQWQSTHLVIGPPKMPKEISERITKAFEIAANDTEYRKFLADRNVIPFVLPPDKTVQFLNEQRSICQKVMEKAGIIGKGKK